MYRKALAATWLLAVVGCVDSPMVDEARDPMRMEADEPSGEGEGSSIRFEWGLPYLLVGQTRYVDAVVRDSLGQIVEGVPIEFSASDPTRVEVETDGAVTGLRAGPVDVIARYGALEATLGVDVESNDAAWLRLSSDFIEMTWLDEARVFVTAYNEHDRELSVPLVWTSGDPDVATVENGRIEPVAPGTADIEVTSGSASAVVRVRVVAPPPSFIDILDAPLQLTVGDRDAIVAIAMAEDRRVIEDAVLEFSSSEPGILWVEGTTGRVKALAEGTATLTVTSGAASARHLVTVQPLAPN